MICSGRDKIETPEQVCLLSAYTQMHAGSFHPLSGFGAALTNQYFTSFIFICNSV